MAQYHDLSDLKKLSHDLKVQAKAAQEAKRVQAAKANRLGAEAAAFREAMLYVVGFVTICNVYSC